MPIEKKIDWNFLRGLRGLYVQGDAMLQKDYWGSQKNLEDYDLSLGTRIRWKWQAVFGVLKERGLFEEAFWSRKGLKILDWGCGSGQALAEFQEWLPSLDEVSCFVYDRSDLAMGFAARKCQAKKWHRETPNVLLLSHVCSELSGDSENAILNLIKSADLTVWVDAGSSEVSRKLSSLRDSLLLGTSHEVLAPCPHQKKCPLSQSASDWCHVFGKTPSSAHQDPFWSKAREELQIDLSQLPMQYLVFGRKGVFSLPKVHEHFFGSAKLTKHDATVLTCAESGEIVPKKISKRLNPEEFKRLKKGAS